MPYPIDLPLRAASAVTASGVGTAFDLAPAPTPPAVVPPAPPRTTAVLTLRVDALAAGASLAVTVQTSPDQLDWTPLGSFTARTATGSEAKRFPGAARYVRAAWTLTGASATFGVLGSALVVLATPADLDAYGINPDALKNLSADRKDRALEAESTTALRILGRSRALPLLAWGEDVRQAVAQLAGISLLMNRGVGPEDTKALVAQRAAAMATLETIASETADPQGMLIDATPTLYDAGAFVSSSPRRGW